MSRRSPYDADENDPMRKMFILIGTAAIAGLLVIIGRYVFLQYVVTKAVSDIQTTTARSFEQIQRSAALAQQAAAERADAEKRAKARAERERIAMRQASIEQAEAAAAAKEAAWKQFYKPSPICANPDNRALMECANGYARAKKEFDQRWTAGRI